MNSAEHARHVMPRKIPMQRRARIAMDAIIEAGRRVLEKDGIRSFNTNKIAEIAGVSVGTVYQIFPSKSAILRVLIEQHFKKQRKDLMNFLNSLPVEERSLEDCFRDMIGYLIVTFQKNRKVEGVFNPQIPLTLLTEVFQKMDEQFIEAIREFLKKHPESKDRDDLHRKATYLFHAVRGILIAKSVYGPEENEDLENQVFLMAWNYFKA